MVEKKLKLKLQKESDKQYVNGNQHQSYCDSQINDWKFFNSQYTRTSVDKEKI